MGLSHTDELYPYHLGMNASGVAGSSTNETTSMKRKRKAAPVPPEVANSSDGRVVIDLTADTPPKKRKTKDANEEQRLQRWRSKAPVSYRDIRFRALNQRMFVLDRRRDTTNPDHPTETISLAGSTGNVYTLIIDKIPGCNCPHARKGNQCKHIVYVLTRVLRVAPELEYQLAFISSELRDIFARAPPLPAEQAESSEKDGNRKPLEGECPICCVDFEPENINEEVVYCKAACGNNIHKECFEQWAATKKGGAVTCPFCRAPWEGDEGSIKKAMHGGVMNEDGYVNVASQLGLSGERDYSTYNPYWVRQRFRNFY